MTRFVGTNRLISGLPPKVLASRAGHRRHDRPPRDGLRLQHHPGLRDLRDRGRRGTTDRPLTDRPMTDRTALRRGSPRPDSTRRCRRNRRPRASRFDRPAASAWAGRFPHPSVVRYRPRGHRPFFAPDRCTAAERIRCDEGRAKSSNQAVRNDRRRRRRRPTESTSRCPRRDA